MSQKQLYKIEIYADKSAPAAQCHRWRLLSHSKINIANGSEAYSSYFAAKRAALRFVTLMRSNPIDVFFGVLKVAEFPPQANSGKRIRAPYGAVCSAPKRKLVFKLQSPTS